MIEQSQRSLMLRAPAKVNLRLQILARRDDGYHELDTVMQKLDLCDILHVQCLQEPGISLRCPGSTLPEDASNLVYKAAALFFNASGMEKSNGVAVVLEKNIPIAAGLGGGSSDAGTLLVALNRSYNYPLSEVELMELAKGLGADVPFFVFQGAAAQAKGIGEQLTPIASLTDCSILLVNPGFSVSTAWVYENFRLTRGNKVSTLCGSCDQDSVGELCAFLYNDLESVTVERYPEIADIKSRMLASNAQGALMSGSGPTVFGLFLDEDDGCSLQGCTDLLVGQYKEGVYITRPLQNSIC